MALDQETPLDKSSWVPDEQAVACFRCDVKFTVTRRRHHCRFCANVVCGKCSKYKLKSERACSTCYLESARRHTDAIRGRRKTGGSSSSRPDPRVTALYDFEGDMANDLSFKQGDVIEVITRTGSQFDWWEGRINGRVGIFPANYVRLGRSRPLTQLMERDKD